MKNLKRIIKDNPGAIGQLDNDSWYLVAAALDPLDEGDWDTDAELASCYDEFEDIAQEDIDVVGVFGGALFVALAQLAGITLESV